MFIGTASLLILTTRISISAGTPSKLLPIEEDCTVVYEQFPDLQCNKEHELFRYTQLSHEFNSASSCATCDCHGYTGSVPKDSPDEEFYNLGPQCCEGWQGSQCNLCQTVDVCPSIKINGSLVMAATSCSARSMVPVTIEEASQGKKFSCTCGGGGDFESNFACPQQGSYKTLPDGADGAAVTRFDWKFLASGSIELAMNAGIHARSWEDYPGQFDYLYPIVWTAELTGCIITEGECMALGGSSDDFADQVCVNYKCADTEVSCPPKDQPECPGGVNSCDIPEGQDKPYQMHPCSIVPDSGVSFQTSCLKEPNEDGSFLCFFKQPTLTAPMSMTCFTGSCLYNITNGTGTVDYDETSHCVPRGLHWQQLLLGGLIVGILVLAVGLQLAGQRREEQRQAKFLRGRNIGCKADSSQTQSTRNFTLSWNETSLWVPNDDGCEKRVIQDVNGTAFRLTAILGPSGSGKTSLLDCLAARKPLYRVEGTIRVNGVVVTRDRMRSISGYVPQEDVLPGYLTVWEHLLFHSTLRCPASLKDSGRRARVLEVLTTLDLNKCAWTRIGDDFNRGLSGGERRRVSLAEELLHPIAVLILDEPLTGLDSNSARSICVALQALSRRGTTVLMSIHQPSCQLFKLLDNVIVLSRGRVIFEGPPEAVPSYIGRLRDICTPIEENRVPFSVCSASNNPADLLLDVASCEWSVDLTQAFGQESRSSLDIENPTIDSFPLTKRDRKKKKKTSWMRRLIAGFETVVLDDGLPQRHMATAWSQTMALSSRLVTAALRRPALLLLQYAGCTFLAISTGAIFFDLKEDLFGVQDRFGVLFFIPFCLVLLGLSSLPVFRDEHILFTHEHSNKIIYGFPAYLVATAGFDVVFVRSLPPTAFALISYRMIGLNQGCDYCLLTFALILVLTNVISSLTAMVIGAFRLSLPLAQLIGVCFALYFALFSGYLLNKESMRQSGFLTVFASDPLSYSFEALLINQFGSQSDKKGNEVYYFINGSMCAPSLPSTLSSGDMILSTFGFEEGNHAIHDDIIALALGALCCVVLAFGVFIACAEAPCVSKKWHFKFCVARPGHFKEDKKADGTDATGLYRSLTDSSKRQEDPVLDVSLEDLLGEQLGRASMAPMVLSFHEISLSVPSARDSQIAGAKVYSEGGTPMELKLSFTIESHDVSLGMNVERDPTSGLGRLVQILPGSWAQRQGLNIGDLILAVGGIRLTSFDAFAPTLEASSRPLLIEVLRHRSHEPNAQIPTESSCSPLVHVDLLAANDPSITTSGSSMVQTWVLRGVSGSTLPSIAYDTTAQLLGSNPVRMTHMVTALLGLSGSGKTSLLDVLSGRKTVGTFTGSVRINGTKMTWSEMRLLSGYVVQENILPGLLSVRECLQFQAQLRLSGSLAVKARRVDDVLQRVQLVAHQRTLIGTAFHRGLSGGEKRRVSVAIELLSEPAILFCDEATTGLDSHSAVSLCRTLEEVARSGTTVVMSVHQPGPEIFALITQAIFLTRDGRVCFCGPGKELEFYLAQHSSGAAEDDVDLADTMLDEIRNRDQDELVNIFKTSQAGRTQQEVLAFLSDLERHPGQFKNNRELMTSRGKRTALWFIQFRHLSFRAMRNAFRNPFPFILHGITAVGAALILGLAFRDTPKLNEETAGVQNRLGIMFFLVLYLSLLALTSLSVWREDQRLFVAERGSGIYCTSSYVAASFLFDVLPYRVLPPLAFTFIAYPLIGLNNTAGHKWTFFAVLLASNLTCSSVCMLVGALARSNASANAAGSLAMLTSILFCGFLFSKRDLPLVLQWILWWSPGNYTFEALVVNEMAGLEGLYVTTTISHSEARAGPFTGEELSTCFGFIGTVNFDLAILVVMSGLYFSGMVFVMKIFMKEVR